MRCAAIRNRTEDAGWAKTVHLDDIALMLFLVAALLGYGTTWTGLSEGQIVTFRMVCLIPCMVVTLYQMLCGKATPLGAVVLLYAVLRITQGFLSISPGNAILQGMLTLLVFAVPGRFADKYGTDKTVSLLFWAFLVITVTMNLFAFSTRGDGFLIRTSEWAWYSNYIFGSKFTLSYTNMFFLALCIYKFRSPIVIAAFVVFCIAACSIADCSTGIVGILLMMAVYLTYGSVKRWLGSKWCVLGIVALMAVVAVAGTGLLQLPAMQSFIVDVLGESSDLTGRLNIYPYLMDLWLQRPLFGYGSDGAVNAVMMAAIGAPDTQEGLFQILFSNGLMGGMLFLTICALSTRGVSRLERRGRGIYTFVIAMAFCSLVEINLSALFLLGLSLVDIMTREVPAPMRDGSQLVEAFESAEGAMKWASKI